MMDIQTDQFQNININGLEIKNNTQKNVNLQSSGKTVLNALQVAGGIVGAGVAIYGACVYFPFLVMKSAEAGAMSGVNSALTSMGASCFVNSNFVSHIATVASGKAYAAMETQSMIGANFQTTTIAGGIGYTSGSSFVKHTVKTGKYVIKGGKSICSAISAAYKKGKKSIKTTWGNRVALQKESEKQLQL